MELATIAPGLNIPNVEVWPNARGTGVIFRFPNGYGASIVRHSGSYGTELAVIHFGSADRDDWRLVYDTPITSDVLGWLTPEECAETLGQIAALPIRRTAIG